MQGTAGTPARSERGIQGLLAFAAGLTLLTALNTLLRLLERTNPRAEPVLLSGEYAVGLLTSVPFIAGVGVGALYLRSNPEYAEGSPRILGWTLGGALVSVVLNGLVMFVTPNLTFWYVVAWLRWAAGIGGGVGTLIGFIEWRAIRNARMAERERVKSVHLQNQRDTLDYLNSLLRHEILNGINVIEGHSRMMAERVDDRGVVDAHIDPVIRRSRDIAKVVSNVRTIMQVVEGDPDLTAMNLRNVLEQEATKVRDTAPETEVSLDVPPGISVQGDEMLPRIFGNVLSNAVEHNGSDPPRITVEARESNEEVVIEITDNGPGIDEAALESLFERPDSGPADHGFGLYLVDRLCSHYGGSIGLVETGADGSTFEIILPSASTPGFETESASAEATAQPSQQRGIS